VYIYICIHMYRYMYMRVCVCIYFLFVIRTLPHTLIEKKPRPPGGFFDGWFPHQEPGGRGPPMKNNPHEEQPPTLINFGGCSSGGILFLRVLDLETTHQRNSPGGGGVLSTNLFSLKLALSYTYSLSNVLSLILTLPHTDSLSYSLSLSTSDLFYYANTVAKDKVNTAIQESSTFFSNSNTKEPYAT